MPSATNKKIYLTRHGQAEHNVTEDWEIRDAILTPLGREQCRELDRGSRLNVQRHAQLIVSSPLRRTMETMLLSYPELIGRLEAEGKPPILLDILQEAGPVPCDTPLYPLDELKNAQGGIFAHLDFSTLLPEDASKQGIFDPKNAGQRAQRVRQWLRARDEEVIVVVAHGDILRWIVDGASQGHLSSRQWLNCETKIFSFKDDNDEQAAMVEIPAEGKVKAKDATADPTTQEMT